NLPMLSQPRKSIGLPTISSTVDRSGASSNRQQRGKTAGYISAVIEQPPQSSSPPPLPPKRLCQSLSLHTDLLRPVPVRPGALANDLESLLRLKQSDYSDENQSSSESSVRQSSESNRKRRVVLCSKSRSFLVGLPDVANAVETPVAVTKDSDSILDNSNANQLGCCDADEGDEEAYESDVCSDFIAEASELLDLELIERDL
ncbi:hypothetical protein BOX15_Mlig023713g1, partial [Macrostomum lignano]